MEQINSRLMDALLPSVDVGASKTSGASEKDSGAFRDLMKEQMTAKNPPKSEPKKDAPAAPSAPQKTEQAAPEDAVQIQQPQVPAEEEQMALAAMAMLQAQPVQEQAVVVEQTAVAVQPVVEAVAQPVVQGEGTPQQTAQQNLMQNGQTDGQTAQNTVQQQNVQTTQQTVQTQQPRQQTVQTAQQNNRSVQPGAENVQQATQLTGDEDGGSAAQPVFRELESIPVKVGEAPAMEGGENSNSVEQQITGKLTEALRNGASKVEIQLDPAALGAVKVELTRSADGAMHVLLSADTLQTRNLLERHAAQLQNILGNQNNAPVQVEVQRGQEDQSANDQHGQGDGQNGQQQEQQHPHGHRHAREQDFMQQLRLGLVPDDTILTEMEVRE